MAGAAVRRARAVGAPLDLLLAGLLVAVRCGAVPGSCLSDAAAPQPIPLLSDGGPRLRGGAAQALKQRNILVDTQCYDKASEQVVDKDQYYPGYALEMSHRGDLLAFEVVPIKGGLVQAFSLNGTSVLLGKPTPDQMDGSIFWPSPQSIWNWPPPAQIDPVPSGEFEQVYAVGVDQLQGMVTLTSPVAPKLEISVRKSFSAVPALGAVLLSYEILNVGSAPKSLAPWEITRVPSNGVSFFAAGAERPTSGKWPPLPVETAEGATWFQQDPARKGGGKLYSDAAKGWLAHFTGELLLVKCFQRLHGVATAPGEKQIELYDGGDYVELELQGPYVSIMPGGGLSWKVMWYLRRPPPGSRDRKALVSFADGLCSDPLHADSAMPRR